LRSLVTGGSGFLGSNLVEFLLKNGYEVICLDNLTTGSKRNIEKFHSNPNFHFIQHDITNPINLRVDQIYNLACPASPIHYQFDPIKTVKTTVVGVLNMLELAKQTGARLLQASTSEVYGDPLQHPQTETYWGNVNPIGLRSCYDEGKRCAETLTMDYQRQHKVQTRIVRIFNTYGPNMAIDDGRVVSNFIVQALLNQDITLYGDGSQTRSFCYVTDLIYGIYKLMNSDYSNPMNIGNPSEFTVKELAELIKSITNSKSKIVYCPLPSDDPTRRKPDVTLATNELQWEPRVDLISGLKFTIDYFESLLSRRGGEKLTASVHITAQG
jgi:UDP-glucuronate decarboxylase